MEEVNFKAIKKEICEPKYPEVACQSLISTKSEPQIWKLERQIQACPKGKYDCPCAIHTNPFYKLINKKILHQTLSTPDKNAENMGKISYTPLRFDLTG